MSRSSLFSEVSLKLIGVACILLLFSTGALAQGGGNTGAGNAGGSAATAEKTPEQISTEAGFGGATSGEVTVDAAPDGSPGVIIYGHWVYVGASVGEHVNWTVSDGEIRFTFESRTRTSAALVRSNPDGSLRVDVGISHPGHPEFDSSQTQTILGSKTITTFPNGAQNITIQIPTGSVTIKLGLLGNDGTRSLDIEGSPGNEQYRHILLELKPGQSIESVINGLNLPPLAPAVVVPPILTVTPAPNGPATPSTPELPSKSAEEKKTPPAGSQTTPGTHTQSSTIAPSGATTSNVALSATFANPLTPPAGNTAVTPASAAITGATTSGQSTTSTTNSTEEYDAANQAALDAGNMLIQATNALHQDPNNPTLQANVATAQGNYTKAAHAAIVAFNAAYPNALRDAVVADTAAVAASALKTTGTTTAGSSLQGAPPAINFSTAQVKVLPNGSYQVKFLPNAAISPAVTPSASTVIPRVSGLPGTPPSTSFSGTRVEVRPDGSFQVNFLPDAATPAPTTASNRDLTVPDPEIFLAYPDIVTVDVDPVSADTFRVKNPPDAGSKPAVASPPGTTSPGGSGRPGAPLAINFPTAQVKILPDGSFQVNFLPAVTTQPAAPYSASTTGSNTNINSTQGNNTGQSDDLVVVTNSRGRITGGKPRDPSTSNTDESTSSGVANAGSPSGETTTTTADTKYGSGGTKETTRDDSTGAVIKEEFKNAKGTTKEISYMATIDGGAVRTDYLSYRNDGTLILTTSTIKVPDGSSVAETFYYDVEGINVTQGSRVETDVHGQVTSYSYDPNSSEWVRPFQLTQEQLRQFDHIIKAMDEYITPKKEATPAPPTPSVSPSSLPGYQVETTQAPGLNITVFTTPNGTLSVKLPNDMAASDTISGTVEEQPTGKTDPERSQNQSALNGYMLLIGQQTIPATEKTFTQQIPATLTPTSGTIALTLNGKTVATIQTPIATTQPPPPVTITLPTGGTQGSSLAITEPTNGKFDSSDYVKLGATTLPELAESPRQKIVLISTEAVGESTLEDRENGNVTRCTFRVLGIRLSAPQLSLMKGQTTILTTVVTGLKGITQDAPLDLTNFSNTVINMAEGNEQHMTIHPSEVSADGTYSVQRLLTGIRAGGFRISGTVRWDNTFSRTIPTSSSAGTSTTPGGMPRTSAQTLAGAHVDALARQWFAKRSAWDFAGKRSLAALDDGMSTADKGKVKAYEQAQKIRWDALMKNMDAEAGSLSGGGGQNGKAAADARGNLKEADDKASAATRAAIDTMAPDKKQTVQKTEAALQQATSEETSAESAYKAARSTPTQ